MFSLTHNVVVALAGIYSILLFATLVVFLLRKSRPQKNFHELQQRINSWWIIISVFSLAMLGNRLISVSFLALVSALALKDSLRIAGTVHWGLMATVFTISHMASTAASKLRGMGIVCD